jgi:uncharacterized protein YigE (DUF2233 family)
LLRLLCLLLVSACTLTSSPNPTPTLTPPTPTPPESTWQMLAPGLERRIYEPDSRSLSALLVLRVDPTQYTFRAVYRPGQPQTLFQWQNELPDAVVLINANFFTPEFRILGLLVSDSVTYGQAYDSYGGTFYVADDVPHVRSNVSVPGSETFQQAVQGFPMLVSDGQQAYSGSPRDRVSRRTAIGQDSAGRILLIITPLLGLSLADFSAYLPATDLGLVHAVNLDGGGSTMMQINTPDFAYTLPSFDSVPAVLAIYPR